jgi:hypothetical protein
LGSLLQQALHLKQPVCLTSIGATADCGMVELETILLPIKFGENGPTRFLGMIQILSDVTQLHGRPIAFQRLAASQLIREDDPLGLSNSNPPPPAHPIHRGHPRAPHLRLVVNHDRPITMNFEAGSKTQRLFEVFGPEPAAAWVEY